MFVPPLPRQRLYTTVGTYGSLLLDLVLGRVHRGDEEVRSLEREICAVTGAPHAIAVNQNRVGIYLAIRALVARGKRNVILSPFTIYDVVNMVLCAGGVPVFADVELASCTVSAGEVERLIDADTAAVLLTHMHVLAQDVDRIIAVCEEHGVPLVEDAAIAFGTSHEGRAVGTLGDVGVFSFGLFKNVSAIFGGAVVCEDEELYREMSKQAQAYPFLTTPSLVHRAVYATALDIATFPPIFRLFTYWVFRTGYLHGIEAINKLTRNDPNPVLRRSFPVDYQKRMTDAQARIARRQLGNIHHTMGKRTQTARYYFENLQDIPEVLLPPLNAEGEDGFLVFPIQVDRRDELLRHLMRVGRDCAWHYYKNCADLPCFDEYRRDCPNARRVVQQLLLLPTYPSYGLREAQKNIEAIREFFAA